MKRAISAFLSVILVLTLIPALAFGAGTCVFMLAFGLFGALIPKKYNKYILKCSTVFIVALGLILMTKGLKLL